MHIDINNVLPAVIVVAIMLLVGLPVHEFSHALAAFRLGDGTAKLFGRLTLNPIAHFDPIGGSLLALTFIGSAATGTPFGFGWAKPTPVNPLNLEGGRRGEAIVAAAGPLSNLILATAGAIPLRYMLANPQLIDQFLIVAQVLDLFVQINLLLMIFNFIPIPPLDGSKVMFAFMDRRTEYQVRPVPRAVRVHLPDRDPVLPAGRFDRPADHLADHGCLLWLPGGRSRVRQFRAHLRATVAPGERSALVTWTTPAQLALFDAMHVADRRHGLDVVASLRAEGVTDPDLLIAGLLHDAGKGQTGVWPRVAYTLGQRYGRWIWRVAALAARVRAGARRASGRTRRRRRRWPPRPDARRGRWRSSATRMRRRIPSSASSCGSPTRRTDDARGGRPGRHVR